MNNIQEHYPDNAIDLRELLTTLWRNKLLILAITAIFSIVGVVYALVAPQVWSAKAIVVAPLPEQLEQLQLRLDNLAALTDITAQKDSEFLKEGSFVNPTLINSSVSCGNSQLDKLTCCTIS